MDKKGYQIAVLLARDEHEVFKACYDERGFNSKIPDGFSATPRRAAVLQFPCAPALPATSAVEKGDRIPMRPLRYGGSEYDPGGHRPGSP